MGSGLHSRLIMDASAPLVSTLTVEFGQYCGGQVDRSRGRRVSLRNVGDLLQARGIEISAEAIRFWWHRFGPMTTWKNPKHGQQWIDTPQKYAFQTIGRLPLSSVGQPEVVSCLSPIWTEKPKATRRLKQRMRAVLDAARSSRSAPPRRIPALHPSRRMLRLTPRSPRGPERRHLTDFLSRPLDRQGGPLHGPKICENSSAKPMKI
jgi:hypothetical protein